MSRRERCSICNEDVVIACQTICEAIECMPFTEAGEARIQNLKNGQERSKAIFEPLDKQALSEAIMDIPLSKTPFVDKTDSIDHPPHYSQYKMEPIEFIMTNNLPAWMANVIKYVTRADAKDGVKDLYKAVSYIQMRIRQLQGHPRWWEKPVAEERKANRA